mmetsp:Transcript_45031/g.95735  ORF Transcript_45031/g.95735 Transcript_45031/m.95735 type:complete len:152 (-) Transcript_45031:150-605(-)
MTSTAGGVVRDLMCLERPRAFHAQRSMYATPALLGAAAFAALRSARDTWPRLVPLWAVVVVPWAIALLLRAAAWTFRLALPHWARKTKSIARVLLDQKARQEYEIKVEPAEGGTDAGAKAMSLLRALAKNGGSVARRHFSFAAVRFRRRSE